MSPQEGSGLNVSRERRYGTFSDSDNQWLRLQTIEGSIVGRKVSYSWCCSRSVLVGIAAVAVFAIAIFSVIALLNECRGISGSKFICYTSVSGIELLMFLFLGICFHTIFGMTEQKESPVEMREVGSYEPITYSTEESSDPSSDEENEDDHKIMLLEAGTLETVIIINEIQKE